VARRPLSNLADVIGKALVKPVAEWTKRAQRDLAVFSRAIGVAPETFAGYAPSTQRKYVAAAKKGRTASEERARVREVRKARAEKKKREQQPTGVSKTSIRNTVEWRRLIAVRDELYAEGLNDEAGPDTAMDSIGARKLYEDESLEAHIRIYGIDYVIEHAESQLAALQQYNQSQGRDRTLGRQRMMAKFHSLDKEVFGASAAVEDEDERWYWYHSSSNLHY